MAGFAIKERRKCMIGIVDVGGGLRDSFGCGILEACFEKNIHFHYAIGVSAGASNLVRFVAGQPKSTLPFYTDYPSRREYMGAFRYVRTRNFVNYRYIYEDISGETGENPFAYKAFQASPTKVHIVATDADSGEPAYFDKGQMRENDYRVLAASACLPGMNRPIVYDHHRYFDGGISDPIPYKKAMQEGCERMIVILTRPRDEYREDRKDRIQSRLIQRRYPKAAEVFRMRAMRYNQALDELKELEKEGSALILAPQSIEGMKTLSFHQEAILHLYHEGKEQIEKIENFLNR